MLSLCFETLYPISSNLKFDWAWYWPSLSSKYMLPCILLLLFGYVYAVFIGRLDGIICACIIHFFGLDPLKSLPSISCPKLDFWPTHGIFCKIDLLISLGLTACTCLILTDYKSSLIVDALAVSGADIGTFPEWYESFCMLFLWLKGLKVLLVNSESFRGWIPTFLP